MRGNVQHILSCAQGLLESLFVPFTGRRVPDVSSAEAERGFNPQPPHSSSRFFRRLKQRGSQGVQTNHTAGELFIESKQNRMP